MASMRSVGVRLRMFVDQYRKDTDEAAKHTEKVGTSGKKAKKGLDDLAGTMTVVGGLMLAAAGVAVVAAAKFDKAMSEVKAVTGATAEEMELLRKAALDAGAATVFSASEAAQAQGELAKAGIKTSDILGGALTGSLSLAAAGSLDLATSAEIAAAAMNTFGLKGKDVEHIADVLAAAANKSSAGVDDLGQGLQQVGLVAAQVGLSLEETVGLLAAFADAGLKGSDGATSLKTALLRLAAPQEEAADLMKELGISLYDSNGNMVDAANIAGQLQAGLGDLAPAQRNAALQTIFGSDAIRAANILYTQGEAGIRDYIAAVDDQGAAAKMAQEKLDNLAGDVAALTGSLETLVISAGSGASGGLRSLVQSATSLVNAFAGLPAPVQTSLVAIAGFGGAGLLATAGLVKLKSGLSNMADSLIAIGPASAKAGKGLQFLANNAGKAMLAVLALTIALQGEKSIRMNGELVDDLAGKYAMFGETAEDTRKNVDAALVKMAETGRVQEAMAAVEEAAKRQGVSVEFAMKHFPEFAAAAGIAATEAEVFAGALDNAAGEAKQLEKAVSHLNGEMLTMRGATRDAEAALDDFQEALKESNGSMDETNEKGRNAAQAFDDLVVAADAVYLKTLEQTGSLEAADAAWNTYIEALRQTMRDANIGEEAINDLIAAVTKVPGKKGIDIEVNAAQAIAKAQAVLEAIQRLRDRTITITTENRQVTFGSGLTMRDGGITVHAAGGLLSKAHVATPPTRFAYAEPETGGEAFIPKRGERSRSMSILSAAAGWYNADVVPRGGHGSGGSVTPVQVIVSPRVGASRDVMAAIVDGLRFDVTQSGNANVQEHVGRRGRV